MSGVACSGCGTPCTCPPNEPCGCFGLCMPCQSKNDAEPDEPKGRVDWRDAPPCFVPTPEALATAAIDQVARPAIVVWSEGRRAWIEKRAGELLAIDGQDKVYSRLVLASDIVRAYDAEMASGKERR